MSLVVVVSATGAPGVTTTVIGLGAVWERRPVVLEADPHGSVVPARYGLPVRPGLASLIGAIRHRSGNETDVLAHAQPLPGGLPVVVGAETPQQATGLLSSYGRRLGEWASSSQMAIIADGGRISMTSPALGLVRGADALAVLIRPELEDIRLGAWWVRQFRDKTKAGLLLLGDKPYGPDAIKEDLGVETLGVLADDPKGAQAIGGLASERALRRSLLVRSLRSVADDLARDLPSGESAPSLGKWSVDSDSESPVGEESTTGVEA